MLVASKAAFLENYLAVSTCILDDLQLNTTRRSVNDSVYLVFDLAEVSNSRAVENELSTLDSFLQPTKSLKFAIWSRKNFVTSKKFKWQA